MAAPEERELTAEQTEKLLQFQVLCRGARACPAAAGILPACSAAGGSGGLCPGRVRLYGVPARAGLRARGERAAFVPRRGRGCAVRDSRGTPLGIVRPLTLPVRGFAKSCAPRASLAVVFGQRSLARQEMNAE